MLVLSGHDLHDYKVTGYKEARTSLLNFQQTSWLESDSVWTWSVG